MIDERELEALEKAVDAFDHVFVDLVQAARRIINIARLDAQKPILKQMEKPRFPGYLGDPCNVCGAFMMVRTGTCVRCDACGNNSGCG